MFQLPNDFGDFVKYKEIIMSAAERTRVLDETLKQEAANYYSYELKIMPELSAIFEGDNVAYVHDVIVTPALPPFLSRLQLNGDDPESSDYTSLKNVEGISNVSGNEDTESKTGSFTGCAYISTESVLLVDCTNGVIKLLNKYALVADSLEFEKSPWDVVQSLDGQVAVTVPKLQTVFFVEAEPHLRIVGQFNTRCECFGICKMEDKYAITCDPWSKLPSVRVFDTLGNVLSVVQTDSIGEPYFKCPLHVCSDYFNTMIYVSDSTANCVYAISLSGEIMFCYEHHDLDYPTGVATDRNNCLYACGKSSANIHKITNTGELSEKFLQKRHGISNPCAIAFHPGGSHVILTDLGGDIATGYWKLHLM